MKDCTTCKYGYEDERLGIPMCHHPKRFSEDCVDFNMHEEKEIKELEKPVPAALEEPCKELKILIQNYYQEHRHDVLLSPYNALCEFATMVAEWQKEQDDRMVDIIYQQGIEKGKDEMMETLKRKE